MQCHPLKAETNLYSPALPGTCPRLCVNITLDMVALSLLSPTGKHSPENQRRRKKVGDLEVVDHTLGGANPGVLVRCCTRRCLGGKTDGRGKQTSYLITISSMETQNAWKDTKVQNLSVPRKVRDATQGCDSAVSLFVLGSDPSSSAAGPHQHTSEGPPNCSAEQDSGV